MHQTHPLRRPLLAGALALAFAAPFPAAGQSRQAPTSPAARPPQTGAVVLAEHPFEIPSLGLAMPVPVDAKVDAMSIAGGDQSFAVLDPAGKWLIRVHSPESSDRSLTPAGVVESLASELQAAHGFVGGKTGEVLRSKVAIIDRQDNLTINGLPVARFYASIPGRSGGAGIVSGYTVFRTTPGQFVIFELESLPREFERTRGVYETILAGVTFRDPAEAAAERAAGVKSGEQLLASLNTSDFQALIPGEERWFRLYRPASTGRPADAEEVAYQRIVIRMGQRGELDPRKPRNRWTVTDRQNGYLVRVDGRFLDGARTVDSESIFFLSLDRESEEWTVRMAVRQGGSATGWTETGARNGDDIKVQVDEPRQPPSIKHWNRPPEGYISQVETYLLPRMLANFGAPAVFSFYRYQSSASDITLRRDVFERGEGGKGWILRTRPNENAAEDVTWLDDQGRILRRELGAGLTMTPIELPQLRSLWQSKGLPLN